MDKQLTKQQNINIPYLTKKEPQYCMKISKTLPKHKLKRERKRHLLNEEPTILEWKKGHVTTSSTTAEIPASDIFFSTQAKSSAKEVCLTL